jgi:hypothetical protein
MARSKNYVSTRQISGQEPAVDRPALKRSAVVVFPENPSLRRELDLSEFLERGVDDWVWACVDLFEELLASKDIQPSTVNSWGSRGFRLWMDFLLQLTLSQRSMVSLQEGHFSRYCTWLSLRYVNPTGARVAYYNTKGILCELMDRGLLPAHLREKLPKNPFPCAGNSRVGTRGLSKAEFQRLASGVKVEVVAANKGNYVGSDAQRIAVHYLVLSMRCGGNTHPLLEIKRSSLRPHPMLPNVMLLEIHKRRGNSTRLVPFRFSRVEKSSLSIPMDAVGILRCALQFTNDLASECPKALRDRVWLYRAAAGPTKGQITCLTQRSLLEALGAIVERRDIRGDDGELLKFGPRRLRKTVANSLWRISGGDLAAVAREMGQTPQVADTHYLELDADLLQEAAAFIGSVFAPNRKNIAILRERTPVAGCKDSLHGERAPKDGVNSCSDFLNCFSCRSFAVVKQEEDLFRLMSFASYLQAEIRCYIGSEWDDWRAYREAVIEGIERFVCKHFTASLLEKVRMLVQQSLHPYWAARMRTLKELR